jgi:hypothetical protein
MALEIIYSLFRRWLESCSRRALVAEKRGKSAKNKEIEERNEMEAFEFVEEGIVFG